MSNIYSVKIELDKNLITPYIESDSPEITEIDDSELKINTTWNEYDFLGGTRWLKQLEFPLLFKVSTSFVLVSKDPTKLGTQVWRFL